MKLYKFASFYNLFATGLFAGATFAAWLAIDPTLHTLGAHEYALVEQGFAARFSPAMPILGITAPICAALLMFKKRAEWRSPAYLLFALGFLLVMVAGIVSGPIDRPSNHYVLSWSPAAPPTDWAETRAKLSFASQIRTWVSVAALFCYLLSIHLEPKAPGDV